MTRSFKLSSLAALLICSSVSAISTQALAATVNVSDNLVVSEINDREIDNGLLDNESTFELAKGTHALVVRYKDVFEDLIVAGDAVVESQNFIIKFTITDQEKLKLTTAKINDLAAAERFAKSPRLQLVDARNNQLELSLERVSDYKLAREVDKAVNALASNQGISKSAATGAIVGVSAPHASNTTKVNALTMLQYWWQNASESEKSRFKQMNKIK